MPLMLFHYFRDAAAILMPIYYDDATPLMAAIFDAIDAIISAMPRAICAMSCHCLMPICLFRHAAIFRYAYFHYFYCRHTIAAAISFHDFAYLRYFSSLFRRHLRYDMLRRFHYFFADTPFSLFSLHYAIFITPLRHAADTPLRFRLPFSLRRRHYAMPHYYYAFIFSFRFLRLSPHCRPD